jgi:hypothetical protein
VRFLLVSLIAIGLGELAGCSLPPPRFAADEGIELSDDGLRPLEHARFPNAWARPGVEFSGYDEIWPQYLGIRYRQPPRADRSGMGYVGNAFPKALKDELTEAFEEIFADEITADGDWRTADANGPNVLILRAALVDLVVHVPFRRLGSDDLAWVSSAADVTLVVELWDSQKQLIVARIADRRSVASGTERPIRATVGATQYEARRIFRDWARRLRSLLDAVKTVELAES